MENGTWFNHFSRESDFPYTHGSSFKFISVFEDISKVNTTHRTSFKDAARDRVVSLITILFA